MLYSVQTETDVLLTICHMTMNTFLFVAVFYIYSNFCDLGAILYDNQEVKKKLINWRFLSCLWVDFYATHTSRITEQIPFQ